MSWNGGILCLNLGKVKRKASKEAPPGPAAQKWDVHAAILNAFQEAEKELGFFPRAIILQEYCFRIDPPDTISTDGTMHSCRSAGSPTMEDLFYALAKLGHGGVWRAVRQGNNDAIAKCILYPVVLFDTDVFECNTVLNGAIPPYPANRELEDVAFTGFAARTLRDYGGRWAAAHLAVKYSATEYMIDNSALSTPLQFMLVSYHGRRNEIRDPDLPGSERHARPLDTSILLPISETFVKHVAEFALKQPFHKLYDNKLNLVGVPAILAGDWNCKLKIESIDPIPGVSILKHIPKEVSQDVSSRMAPEGAALRPRIDYAISTNPLPTDRAQRYAAKSGAKAQAPCIVEIGEITELAHLAAHHARKFFDHNPFVMAFTLTAGAEAATLMPMSQAPIGNIKPITVGRQDGPSNPRELQSVVAPAAPPTPSPTQPARTTDGTSRAASSSSRQLVLEPLQELASETTLEVPPVVPKSGFFKRVVSIMRAVSFESASRRSRTTVSASLTAGDEGSLSTDGRGGSLGTMPSHPVLDTEFTSGSSSGSVHVEEADNAGVLPASTPGPERASLRVEEAEVDAQPASSPGSESASVHEEAEVDAQPASTPGSESASVHEEAEVDVLPASTPGSDRASVHEEEKTEVYMPAQILESPRPFVGAKIELWRRRFYQTSMERTEPMLLSELPEYIKPMILDALQVAVPTWPFRDRSLAKYTLLAASAQEWWPAGAGEVSKRGEYNKKVMEHPEIFDNLRRYLAPHL